MRPTALGSHPVGSHVSTCLVWVQIRELLEKLLDDDDDMRDMNLTARCGPFTSLFNLSSLSHCCRKCFPCRCPEVETLLPKAQKERTLQSLLQQMPFIVETGMQAASAQLGFEFGPLGNQHGPSTIANRDQIVVEAISGAFESKQSNRAFLEIKYA